LLAACGALAGLAGCGHPATREECDVMFAKNAEIELRAQNITDPNVIAERTVAARAVKGDDFFAHCIGKKITSRAVECIRKATTATQMDHCLAD
jgi:hypothetical protein